MNFRHISFFVVLALSVILAGNAEAFIPSSQFIFTRVAAQHGKGGYVIEDDVTFQQGIENLVVHENWVVADGGEMRLQAEGDGLKTFRILKHGRTYWVDETGSERADELSQDDFMRALLTRGATEEKRLFISWGILPAETLREKRLPKDLKDYHLETEPFVRLGRVAGTIAYAYGKPSPAEGVGLPGLWVEQDAFNIRKMRTPDGSEIDCNDYVTFARGLSFPKSQSVTFDNHVVSVHVTSVMGRELTMDQKRQLDVNWLRSHRDIVTVWPKTTLGPVLQEFYKRFR